MSPVNSDPPSTSLRPAPDFDGSPEERLRELRLELRQTRSRATAAKLEAQAAELELRIERLTNEVAAHRAAVEGDADERTAAAEVPAEEIRRDASHADPQHFVPSLPRNRRVRAATVFRPRQETKARSAPPETAPPETAAVDQAAEPAIQSWDDLREAVSLPADEHKRKKRRSRRREKRREDRHSKSTNNSKDAVAKTEASDRVDVPAVPDLAIDAEAAADEETTSRNRPAAFMVSAIVHGLLLIALALFTLSSDRPGDQVAIAGAIAETDEVAIESLDIQTPELEPQVSEPTPEAVVEISELGELPIAELTADVPPAPPSPLADSLLTDSSNAAAAMSLKSESDAKIKFCGVEGGGNHFVYLVDSSGSMGSAFDSAREELLRSIDALQPHQRFYVIFFDSEPDYMRLSSPNADEQRSAYATPENKRTLQRWAMSIQMDRGKAPYEALPFAIDLQPDVIFLLSDGEFPQRIEDVLKDINHVDNLFGDNNRVSIVHTIGYHSREGESRMKRIAAQNGGQYRHVPKP